MQMRLSRVSTRSLDVALLVCAATSDSDAQSAPSTRRAETSMAASNIPLARNGEPVEIAGLAGIRVASNGALLFADSKPVTVNVREPRDGHVRQIARAGAGPGEYKEAPAFVGYRGDSIVAYDAALKRWSLLSPDGVFVRMWPTGPETAAFAKTAVWVSNGSIIFNASLDERGAPLVESIAQVSAQLRGQPLIIRQVGNVDLWAAPTFTSSE